jgi:release factor glutamine methyltransferase
MPVQVVPGGSVRHVADNAVSPIGQGRSRPTTEPMPSTEPRQVVFGPVTLTYDESCLTPRPWTLEQSTWVATVEDVPTGPILELCAGVGQIGLVAALLTGRRLVQVDSNPGACRWARVNADRAGLGDRVEIRQCDLDEAVRPGEQFAIIVADPPYMPTHEVGSFDDPVAAIDGGADGLDTARRCMELADEHLAPGGLLSVQLRGRAQADSLRDAYFGSGRTVLEPEEVRDWGTDRAVAHFRGVLSARAPDGVRRALRGG